MAEEVRYSESRPILQRVNHANITHLLNTAEALGSEGVTYAEKEVQGVLPPMEVAAKFVRTVYDAVKKEFQVDPFNTSGVTYEFGDPDHTTLTGYVSSLQHRLFEESDGSQSRSTSAEMAWKSVDTRYSVRLTERRVVGENVSEGAPESVRHQGLVISREGSDGRAVSVYLFRGTQGENFTGWVSRGSDDEGRRG